MRAGVVFPRALQGRSQGKYPFAKVSDMNLPENGVFIETANNWVDDDDIAALRAKPFPPETVIFAKIGEGLKQNRLRFLIKPTLIDNNMMGAMPIADKVDSRFFFYALSQIDFGEIAVGTALPYLTVRFLSEIELPLPPLPAQRAIARILGAFDDKIALNAKMNATLEAMAQALFRAWFIDFEPVRAKRSGRWRPGQTLPGMPAALYDLFPAELTPTELGDAPVGWELRTIGDELATLVSGARPRGGAVKSGIPSIGAENVLGLGKYDFSKEKYVPPDYFDRLKRRGADVRNGDVLLYKDGAKIGRKTYFDKDFPHARCAVNEHAFILRLRNAAAQRYLYFWLGQNWMTHKIITLNSNTAQPGINQKGVRGLPILMPTDDMLSAFDDIASDITGRIFAACHESRSLAAMRDALLPKLLSGEVRVE